MENLPHNAILYLKAGFGSKWHWRWVAQQSLDGDPIWILEMRYPCPDCNLRLEQYYLCSQIDVV
uniref:Uncharacterized protein n=1 Tax=Arundo donax TaxID=35708 RepID=A0A0A9A1N1_ARUDO